MGRVRSTTPTWDRARRPIDEFRARAEPLPITQLEGGGGSSMLRTPNPLPSDPAWFSVPVNSVVARDDDVLGHVGSIPLSSNAILGRVAAAKLDEIIAANNTVLAKHGALGLDFRAAGNDTVYAKFGIGDLGFQPAVARRVLARGSSGDLEWKSPAKFLAEVMDLATTGTSFPGTNLYDGRPFYRTDLHTLFHHDTGTSGWIGSDLMTLHGGETINESAYLDIIPFNAVYNANTKGYAYPFDVKPVWMAARVLGSSTCTMVIRADGTNVTSAVLTWTAEAGKKTLELLGGTIAKDENIAFAIDTGTAVPGGPPIIIEAAFRRFET